MLNSVSRTDFVPVMTVNDERQAAEQKLKQIINTTASSVYIVESYLESVAAFVQKNKHLLDNRDLRKLSTAIKNHGHRGCYKRFIAKLTGDYAAPSIKSIPPEIFEKFFDFCRHTTLAALNDIISTTNVYLSQLNRGRQAGKVFSSFSNLLDFLKEKSKCLTILDCSRYNLDDQDLKSIVHSCPNLVRLNLAASYKITDKGFAHLTALTQLQWLDLEKCDKITDAGLVHLTALTQLQLLDLKECVKITDAGLVHLTALTQLKELNLYWCDKITDKGVAHLIALTQLQALNLEYCDKITEAGLAHLIALTQL